MCYSRVGNFRSVDSRRRPENGATCICIIYPYKVSIHILIRVRQEKIRYKFTMLSQFMIHTLYIDIITHETKHHYRQQQKYIAHVALRLLRHQSWIEIPLLLLLLLLCSCAARFRRRRCPCEYSLAPPLTRPTVPVPVVFQRTYRAHRGYVIVEQRRSLNNQESVR